MFYFEGFQRTVLGRVMDKTALSRDDLQKTLLLSLLGAVILTLAGCHSRAKLPDKASPAYKQVVSAFYVGLAALQVGDDVHAESKLSEVTQLVPAEPAGWANWGILALRQRNYDVAAQRLERARDLAPQNDHIYDLLGILESQRGNSTQAIADLRKAAELNPQNLKAIYQLAEEIERQGDVDSESEVQQLLQKILAAQPNNLATLVELSRIAAKRGDVATRSSAEVGYSAASSGRFRLTGGSNPNDFPAERADARSRVSSEPAGHQVRCRGGSQALHSFPEIGVSRIQAISCGHGDLIQSSANHEPDRRSLEVGRGDSAG
jgi:Flp pilus assembly protein TadD